MSATNKDTMFVNQQKCLISHVIEFSRLKNGLRAHLDFNVDFNTRLTACLCKNLLGRLYR